MEGSAAAEVFGTLAVDELWLSHAPACPILRTDLAVVPSGSLMPGLPVSHADRCARVGRNMTA
jgi:hypothetical protein